MSPRSGEGTSGSRGGEGAASAPQPAPGEYVLGTNAVELARLALQHEVWGGATDRFFERLGVGPGWRCLDVGCGPGFVIESLRRRVGPTGRVDALDESPVWHAHLERTAAQRGWTNVHRILAHVQDAVLEPGAYDLVFARWVFSFLPDVAGIVAKMTAALRPGGVLAVQDYNHEGISVFPESRGLNACVRATRALYASRGGDVWIAGRLPGLFRRGGLEPRELHTTVLAGGPTSGVFRWADSFYPLHSENMVRAGVLTPEERVTFLEEWAARKANPDTVFFSPIVVDAAGVKPGARRPSS